MLPVSLFSAAVDLDAAGLRSSGRPTPGSGNRSYTSRLSMSSNSSTNIGGSRNPLSMSSNRSTDFDATSSSPIGELDDMKKSMSDIAEILKSRNEKEFGATGEELNLKKAKKYLDDHSFIDITTLKVLAYIRECKSWGEPYGKASKLFNPDIKRARSTWKSSDLSNLKSHAILGIVTSMMLALDDLSKSFQNDDTSSDDSSKEFEDLLNSDQPVFPATLQKAIRKAPAKTVFQWLGVSKKMSIIDSVRTLLDFVVIVHDLCHHEDVRNSNITAILLTVEKYIHQTWKGSMFGKKTPEMIFMEFNHKYPNGAISGAKKAHTAPRETPKPKKQNNRNGRDRGGRGTRGRGRGRGNRFRGNRGGNWNNWNGYPQRGNYWHY